MRSDGNGRVTMAVIGTKLDQLIETMEKHRQEFKEHVNADALIAMRVDRLDQREQSRQWHIRAIWGSILTGIVAYFIKH